MKLLKNERVINIIEKTLNFIDARLNNHGRRVAYRVYKVFEAQNKYDDAMLRDICLLAMLHDIGAYRTEDIDRMVMFEEFDVWEHSAYGYLFLKHFTPLKDLAPAILFHHAGCDKLDCLEPFLQELANTIFLCDRADVFSYRSDSFSDFLGYIELTRDVKFRSDVIEKFLATGLELKRIGNVISDDTKFNRILYSTPLSNEEVDSYLRMIIFSIDFRSSQTMIHTIATTKISTAIGGLLGVDEKGIEILETGAMLHDIGKIGVPITILESANRLNEEEFAIMKKHVEITEKIIDGNVDEEIKTLAINHHEKINGTGYPRGITDLSFYDRILAIADIFSALCGERTYKAAYLKEKIVEIVAEMSRENLIDCGIAALSLEHFDEILAEVERVSKPVVKTYTTINNEYKHILDCVRSGNIKAIPLYS